MKETEYEWRSKLHTRNCPKCGKKIATVEHWGYEINYELDKKLTNNPANVDNLMFITFHKC